MGGGGRKGGHWQGMSVVVKNLWKKTGPCLVQCGGTSSLKRGEQPWTGQVNTSYVFRGSGLGQQVARLLAHRL